LTKIYKTMLINKIKGSRILEPFFISIILILFVSCGNNEKSNTILKDTNTTITIDPLKTLSFFAWDGVKNYENILSKLEHYNKPTIYLNPLENGENTFIKNSEKLHDLNSNIWYLTSAISDYPSDDYLSNQINTIVQYNSNHSKKIIGMSFDFEPWIEFTDQNSSDNITSWNKYLDFMNKAKTLLKNENLNISIIIPFWLDKISQAYPNNRPLNYDIIDIADEVIVMAYTKKFEDLLLYSKSSLIYADSTNKSIKIALEMVENNNPEITFYGNAKDIKNILYKDINYTSFDGYNIHTLDAFYDSNITLSY